MSHRKTAVSALTAVALVTGIGFAWAQTEQNQPVDPMAAATAATPTSEQTPADPNAATTPATPIDSTSQLQQQQTQPVDDMNRQAQPMNNSSTTPLPSDSSLSTMDGSSATTNSYDAATTTSTTDSGYEPAPRADRN